MSIEFTLVQSDRLVKTVNAAMEKFAAISSDKWNEKLSEDKWSKKEILGHLIDSAANNHLRFVRAQLEEKEFNSFTYEQNFYVARQHYQERKAEEIIALWSAYNLHIAHVIKHVAPVKLNVICRFGHYEPDTLSFFIKDYIDHMEHHLKQIFS